MRRLVQWVERQPAPDMSDPRLERASRGATDRQTPECPGQLVAQPAGLEELPVVEACAITQAEPGHEVVAVERHRIGQWGDTVRAYLRRRVAVRPAFGHAFGEALQVKPAPRLSVEAD